MASSFYRVSLLRLSRFLIIHEGESFIIAEAAGGKGEGISPIQDLQ